MAQHTYSVSVEIDSANDSAVLTVNGASHRYPWHWSDNLATMARRAVTDNYRVTKVESVVRARVGAYIVTADTF